MADTKDTAQQQPKFDWDYDIPSELEDMNFDGTLSAPAKFAFLLSLLEARLATRKAAAAPVPAARRRLPRVGASDARIWNMPEEAETLRIMLETSEGDRRVPWLNMLAGFKLRHGEYAEAERLEREVLPWMQKRERLGIDSPQALGTTRTIIEALWKQGGSKSWWKRWGSSKFAKYQEEERQMLRDLVAELEKS
ncbi:hypothetical protein B0H14DRAFT_2589239 [Mycena olivaceomarginata]|nr:hypothetical protein B0H14DRAFT_2589239 [Mycena olivaceomarginata]